MGADTPAKHHRFLSEIQSLTSPVTKSSTTEHRPTHVAFSFSMKALSLRQLQSNVVIVNNRRFQRPRFCPVVADSAAMATKDNLPLESKKEETKVEKEEEKKKLPPPPEKPEPGDCCGSGCVRCVWDVYYEELEEYNKLINTDGQSKSS